MRAMGSLARAYLDIATLLERPKKTACKTKYRKALQVN